MAPFANQPPPHPLLPGYLIYLQGTEATCFYYLKQGRVRSFIQSEDGGERVLSLYGPGSLFGEAAFFDGLPRVSSAVALTPCQLVPIDRELVTREIARTRSWPWPCSAIWPGRCGCCPARWTRWPSAPPGGGWPVPPVPGPPRAAPSPVARRTSPPPSSASRVTVSRILGDFARRGWVEPGYRTLTLRSPAALEKLCQL